MLHIIVTFEENYKKFKDFSFLWHLVRYNDVACVSRRAVRCCLQIVQRLLCWYHAKFRAACFGRTTKFAEGTQCRHCLTYLLTYLLYTHADWQDVTVCSCICTVTNFSAEDKASGVKFCSAVHRRPRQGMTKVFVNFASPEAPNRTNRKAHGPRPPACKHYNGELICSALFAPCFCVFVFDFFCASVFYAFLLLLPAFRWIKVNITVEMRRRKLYARDAPFVKFKHVCNISRGVCGYSSVLLTYLFLWLSVWQRHNLPITWNLRWVFFPSRFT